MAVIVIMEDADGDTAISGISPGMMLTSGVAVAGTMADTEIGSVGGGSLRAAGTYTRSLCIPIPIHMYRLWL